MGEQFLGQRGAQGLGLGARAADLAAHDLAAVHRAHQAAQPEGVALQHRMAADGHLAAAFQARVHGALGQHPVGGVGVVQGGEQGVHPGVVGAAFDAHRALPDRRQAVGGVDGAADALREAEPDQAGGGEDHRVVFALVQLAQTGVDVAAQRADLQVGPAVGELALAAQAGGAHHRALRQLVQRGMAVADEGVARVLALHDHRQVQPLGQLHRHVLHGVHRDVGVAFEHARLQLLYEQPLAADLGQRGVEDLVALGAHAQDFHLQARMGGAQGVGDVLGLPQGER